MQHQSMGLRMADELDAEQIGDLALVPAEERADRGDAGDRACAGRTATRKSFACLAAACEIAKLQLALGRAYQA